MSEVIRVQAKDLFVSDKNGILRLIQVIGIKTPYEPQFFSIGIGESDLPSFSGLSPEQLIEKEAVLVCHREGSALVFDRVELYGQTYSDPDA